jgi:transcriptional regulator
LYQPPLFRETRPDILHALIRSHPLGLLVSNGADGPVANPLPFLLDTDVPPHGRLRVHLAKANPHWRLLADNPGSTVLVVFQGADSYITPSWYETKRETGKVVPTWNYAMVQVRGTTRIVEDQEWLARQISDLTGFQENSRPEIEGFISIAPQPNTYDFSFLAPCPSSGLIIHGDADKVAPPKDVQGLVDKLHTQKGITITQKTLPGANHFFANDAALLLEECADYLDRRLAGELSDPRPKRLR